MTDAAADGVRCMLMRGGTSKGAFFLPEDLPDDPAARADLLLRIMGSPDPRQIDGIGGAHPLTSKVAIVSIAGDDAVDLDYRFLQVAVDSPEVSDAQTCGNLLAAVGPFAVERGLVAAGDPTTTLRIRLLNTGDIATATFATPHGRVDYAGDAAIDGVPGTACRIDLAVASGGRPLLPAGETVTDLDGTPATLVDAGMPVVLLDAAGFGVQGGESPADLESRDDLTARVEHLRLLAGAAMGLGDVTRQTVPKMVLLSPAASGGAVGTRSFIPHRVHEAIGVLAAASVAAGVQLPGAVGSGFAHIPADGSIAIEHPGGAMDADVRVERTEDGAWTARSASMRTARKLFDGTVYPRT